MAKANGIILLSVQNSSSLLTFNSKGEQPSVEDLITFGMIVSYVLVMTSAGQRGVAA